MFDRGAERRPPGPRSPVPGITAAGLLIVVGLLVLINRFTSWDPGARVFLGAALLVVGLGLIAAAFSTGRRAKGGLIALGVLLSLALVSASAAPFHGGSGVGDRVYRPVQAADVPRVYQGNVGDMTVDLTDVRLAGLETPIRTRIEQGLGDLEIDVPRSADVEVRVDSGLGDVTVFGQDGRADGFYRGTGSAAWSGDDTPEFVLTVHAGLGDVEVSRA
jgi:hypothetical protein